MNKSSLYKNRTKYFKSRKRKIKLSKREKIKIKLSKRRLTNKKKLSKRRLTNKKYGGVDKEEIANILKQNAELQRSLGISDEQKREKIRELREARLAQELARAKEIANLKAKLDVLQKKVELKAEQKHLAAEKAEQERLAADKAEQERQERLGAKGRKPSALRKSNPSPQGTKRKITMGREFISPINTITGTETRGFKSCENLTEQSSCESEKGCIWNGEKCFRGPFETKNI